MNHRTMFLLTTALILLSATVAFSQEKKKDNAQQLSAESEEMMKKWQAAMTPGEAHKKLDAFVGSWTTTSSIWMGGPGTPPTVTAGAAEVKWNFGGRFIQQEMDGFMMDLPMRGIGFTGYDNVNKKYIGFWIDNTSTAMFTSEGNFNQDGSVLTTYGKMDDPTTGQHDKTVKYVWRIINKDKHIFEIHDLDMGEPNTKIVEIVYTRKK